MNILFSSATPLARSPARDTRKNTKSKGSASSPGTTTTSGTKRRKHPGISTARGTTTRYARIPSFESVLPESKTIWSRLKSKDDSQRI